jgi:outer membrane immunogenic protein
VGAQVGAGAQTDGWASADAYYGNNGANGIGAVGGGQIGCNYQTGMLVVGVEGDGLWSGLTNTNAYGANSEGYHYQYQTKNTWDADIALRVGAAFDRLLVYGKGGVAWGGFTFKETYNYTGCSSSGSCYTDNGSATLPGVLIGIGMEYAFLPNWTAKLEYNYIAFEQQSISFTEGYTGSTLYTYQESYGATKQLIKFGINYKFF